MLLQVVGQEQSLWLKLIQEKFEKPAAKPKILWRENLWRVTEYFSTNVLWQISWRVTDRPLGWVTSGWLYWAPLEVGSLFFFFRKSFGDWREEEASCKFSVTTVISVHQRRCCERPQTASWSSRFDNAGKLYLVGTVCWFNHRKFCSGIVEILILSLVCLIRKEKKIMNLLRPRCLLPVTHSGW